MTGAYLLEKDSFSSEKRSGSHNDAGVMVRSGSAEAPMGSHRLLRFVNACSDASLAFFAPTVHTLGQTQGGVGAQSGCKAAICRDGKKGMSSPRYLRSDAQTPKTLTTSMSFVYQVRGEFIDIVRDRPEKVGVVDEDGDELKETPQETETCTALTEMRLGLWMSISRLSGGPKSSIAEAGCKMKGRCNIRLACCVD